MILWGLVGGIGFGLFIDLDVLERGDETWELLALGAAYGVLLWVLIVVLAIPAWTEATTAGSYPFPNLHLLSLAGFLVYGLLVAGGCELLGE
jgi:hypothetical protein